MDDQNKGHIDEFGNEMRIGTKQKVHTKLYNLEVI